MRQLNKLYVLPIVIGLGLSSLQGADNTLPPDACQALGSSSFLSFSKGRIKTKSQASPTNKTPEIIIKLRDGVVNLSTLKSNKGIELLLPVSIKNTIPQMGAKKLKVRSLLINPKKKSPLSNIIVVEVGPNENLKALSQRLSSLPDVEYAEPNGLYHATRTPNDPLFNDQWGFGNNGQPGNDLDPDDPSVGTAGADINAIKAWDITTGSRDIKVAIVDSGIEWYHSDLSGNIWVKNNDPINGLDDDNNGLVDDCMGWDWVFDDNDPDDFNGHGTHVAGIVGAVANNGIGVSGLMWNVQLMPLRALDEFGDGTVDDVARAIVYATNEGADIINLSVGGFFSSLVDDAVNFASDNGVVLIGAAGNSGENTVTHPASNSRVIAVAAVNREDKLAPFSNFGPGVDVTAPGVSIRSTYLNNTYIDGTGTSQATPMVTGLAGLIMSEIPNISQREIKDRIKQASDSIDNLNPSRQGEMGEGRINAAFSLAHFRKVTYMENPSDSEEILVRFEGISADPAILPIFVGSSNGAPVEIGPSSLNFTGALMGEAVYLKAQLKDIFSEFLIRANRYDVRSQSKFRLEFDGTVHTRFQKSNDGNFIHALGIPEGDVLFDINFTAGTFNSMGAEPVKNSVPAVEGKESLISIGSAFRLDMSRNEVQSVRITIPLDSGITDFNSNASQVRIAFLDETWGSQTGWNSLNSQFNPVDFTVEADFTVPQNNAFRTFQFRPVLKAPQPTLGDVRVVPNPFKPNQPGYTDITFTQLKAGSKIMVIDLTGELIKELHDSDGDGSIVWNGKDENGRDLGTGVYFYRASSGGDEKIGKLAVIR